MIHNTKKDGNEKNRKDIYKRNTTIRYRKKFTHRLNYIDGTTKKQAIR